MGIIYAAVNKSNNKVYIGYTEKTLEQRRHEHEDRALNKRDIKCRMGGRGSLRFYNAIRKYGTQAFNWKILCECHELSELKMAEQVFVAYYDSFNKEYGYNMTPGGEGVMKRGDNMIKFFGEEKAAEIKEKIRQKTLGSKLTPEQYERFCETMSSDHHREKLRIARRNPELNARILLGSVARKKTEEQKLKHRMSLSKRFPLTDEEIAFIVEKHKEGRAPAAITQLMKPVFGKMPSPMRIKRELESRGYATNPPAKRSPRRDPHWNLGPELYHRIVGMLEEGYSPVVIETVLENGVSAAMIVRMRTQINKRRAADRLQPLESKPEINATHLKALAQRKIDARVQTEIL